MQFIVKAVAMKLAHLAGDLVCAEELSRNIRRDLASIGDSVTLLRIWTLTAIGHLYLDLGSDRQTLVGLLNEGLRLAYPWRNVGRLDAGLHGLAKRLQETDRPTPLQPPRVTLSSAELRVLQYLPSHFTLPRVAQELHRSTATIRSQCMSIYRKLGVQDRESAVFAARDLGLLAESTGGSGASVPDEVTGGRSG